MVAAQKKFPRTIKATDAKPGQWIVYSNTRMNERIVDVKDTRDGQVLIHTDFGNGGEPASSFFNQDDKLQVADSNDA